MDLPIEVSLVISAIAALLVWLLRLAFVSKGREVPAFVYTVVVGILSLVIAAIFSPLQLPPFPPLGPNILLDLAAIVGWLIAVLPAFSSLVGFATLIYNVLKDKILDGLGDAIRRRFAGSDIG